MNEETTNASVTNTDAQPTETETEQKKAATPQNEANQENSEQKSFAKNENVKKANNQYRPQLKINLQLILQ